MNWLTNTRQFPGAPHFPGLRAIAAVEAEVERNGRTSRERRCYLSSMPLDAKLFAHAVRCQWHIENRLHWVPDVVFHKDLSRLRSGAGPQNMATVRHTAMNLLRGSKNKHSLKVRRNSPLGTPPTSKHCSSNQRERASSDCSGHQQAALA